MPTPQPQSPGGRPGCQTYTFIAGIRGQMDKLEAFIDKDSVKRSWAYEDAIRSLCDRVTDLTDDIVQGNYQNPTQPKRIPPRA